MPRQARFDASGTLHHIIIRGIEKRKIVDDRKDRENFIERVGRAASDKSERNRDLMNKGLKDCET
ncbi:MAG: hypothetical protein VST71_02940 [Nitrospirota bacterium]|nr:hypothetical protein [Nitrospirota bacterium]